VVSAAALDERLLTGRAAPLPEPVVLRAGPVTALLDGADLRHVRHGDVELVQRVYMAVRDAPWNTIPATFTDWRIEQGEDRFTVTFVGRHVHDDIDFGWCGAIDGGPDGTITYTFDGTCHGVFRYSKIGLNVHHALADSVGHAYRSSGPAGERRGTLPEAIDPQRIVNGTLSGMFDPYESIAIEVRPGFEAVVSLEGDLLELQDHRNWTDGNFKSYATPLALGFPFTSDDGRRIRQVLTVGYAGTAPAPVPAGLPTIALGSPVGRLPAIGFGQPSHGEPLTAREKELVALVRPAHLRVDLALDDPAAGPALDRAIADASAVGASLELAVHANETSGPALATLAGRLRGTDVAVARVLVYLLAGGFSALGGLTPAPVVALVREQLEPVTGAVTFAGGTNQSFGDVNRDRPSSPVLSGLCFAMSPTIHAADDASVLESLVGESEVIEMARSIAWGRRVIVSPLTIATRFGPYPAGPSAPGDLPAPVDVRQASLFGAAFTAGSIARLASSGADAVTYYETSGWRGIVERDAGSPDPRFPSRPGDVFPLYHVFADVAEWGSGDLIAADSSEPLTAEGLAIRDADGTHALVANLTRVTRRIAVTGLPGATASVRVLDASSASWATADPAGFRAAGGVATPISGGRLELALAPYAVARIDAA
jgi:D-apionolactonase